jgi:DNA-binding LacI/PurR family transcriptional regulator
MPITTGSSFVALAVAAVAVFANPANSIGSTVTVYTSATGRLAAQALLRVIAGKSPPAASSQRLLSQLVVRGSTGTVPK